MAYTILFLTDNGLNESLPATEISAVLKQNGFQTDLLILRDEGAGFFNKIDSIRPDAFIVFFDILGQQASIELTERLKERYREIPIVGLGTYASLYPEVLRQCKADIVCRGEAELALLELFQKLQAGQSGSDVLNCWVKTEAGIVENGLRPLMHDLDSLPTPDRELYYDRYPYLRRFSTKRVIAGRGCANRCHYCYNAALQDMYNCRGRNFTRKKSPKRVLKDIADLVSRATVRSIYFIDDLFTDNREWLVEFCSLLPERFRIPYACNITADSVTEEKVQVLKRSGCRAVLMGVETGDESLRTQLLNKKVTDRQIVDAVALFKKFGLLFLTYTMMGLPGESGDGLFKSIELNQKLKPDYMRVTIAFPMPFTRMTETAIEQGIVSREKLNRIFEMPSKDQYTTSAYQADPRYVGRVRRLYYLFPLSVKLQLSRRTILNLAKVPLLTGLLKWISYFTVLWQEKGIFNITLLSGARFFFHTGHPLNKTKNANNFIP